ncbi:peptidoglycan-binding domain-containing protein [Terrarubrum flagellatum]|uniref:peptidoglycan-binding domain-containing protein n=1 Tax=Terrirubrum flagellatum TaxID=2895980 RepID=UPI0031452B15
MAALFAIWLPAAAQAQTPPAAAPVAQQMALDTLKKRPWLGSLRSVLAETNAQAKSKLDAAFEDLWSEQQTLAEAEKRIDAGLREGRPPAIGAVNDALDLSATAIATRAGCFAAFVQRPEFRQQAAALAALKVDGKTPEPFRSAIRDYAVAPCDAPQTAKDFDPRRAWEAGRKLFNTAAGGGGMRTLARFLDDRNLLKTPTAADQAAAAKAAVEANFQHFDGLYDGHTELVKSYRALFADYCPTDPRFCGLRDMLSAWGDADGYCGEVTKFIAAYYGDGKREYLIGAENAGLNRAWEAYHLKFAPACLRSSGRVDLVPVAVRRLEVMEPLFTANPKTLGENGVAKLRDELQAVATDKRTAEELAGRVKAYRAASGIDQQVASVAPNSQTVAPVEAALPPTPTDDELKAPGTESGERDLKLDRTQIVDVQERLASIGGSVVVSGWMNQATRAAIKSWQGAVGLEPSGFFTRPQLDLLKIRTQDRWLQWRATRNTAAVEPPAAAPREPRRRQARRPAGGQRRYSDDGLPPGYVLPRGGATRARGAYPPSDIPGAIPAYRVWN